MRKSKIETVQRSMIVKTIGCFRVIVGEAFQLDAIQVRLYYN